MRFFHKSLYFSRILKVVKFLANASIIIFEHFKGKPFNESQTELRILVHIFFLVKYSDDQNVVLTFQIYTILCDRVLFQD